jgi:hypothetical protein
MMGKDNEIFWQVDDGRELAKARAGTELTRAIFSRALSISEKQLTQLEEGGSTAFYSERIKYQMGARILGYFDIQTVSQKAMLSEEPQSTVVSEPVKLEVLEQLDSIYETNHKSIGTAQTQPQTGFQLRNGYVLGAALVAAAAFGIAYMPDALLKQPPNAASRVMPAQQTDLTTMSELFAQAEPAEPAKPQLLNCDWSGSPTPLKPISATRPADRVLLVAKSDIELCLKDGIGQEKVIKLQAGDRQTFHGSGNTWHLYTPQMDYLQVFFQGFHVAIPKQTTHFIKLEPYF